VAKEAGFDIKISRPEFATSLNLAARGSSRPTCSPGGGRADPDGNLQTFIACKGPLNTSGYCVPEVDEAIEKARPARPGEAAPSSTTRWRFDVTKDRPIIYLYHAHTGSGRIAPGLTGLRTVPDGMVRVQGLQMK